MSGRNNSFTLDTISPAIEGSLLASLQSTVRMDLSVAPPFSLWNKGSGRAPGPWTAKMQEDNHLWLERWYLSAKELLFVDMILVDGSRLLYGRLARDPIEKLKDLRTTIASGHECK